MNEEIKEILEDVKRHLDYVEATKQASIRDNEMKAMYDYITNLQQKYVNAVTDYELEKSKNIQVVNNCEKSIESINKKLENNKEPYEVIDGKLIYLNEYQVVRLKAIRMKCKELLNILGGDENEQL